MPTRTASATWEGGLKGTGRFEGQTGLGAQFNFSSRFENGAGSNPEELLAAAEAACFSMALSIGLERQGTPATRVHTTAKCTVEKVGEGFRITTMTLDVKAKVNGMSADQFTQVAQATKENCPVSQALKNNVKIELTAALES